MVGTLNMGNSEITIMVRTYKDCTNKTRIKRYTGYCLKYQKNFFHTGILIEKHFKQFRFAKENILIYLLVKSRCFGQ